MDNAGKIKRTDAFSFGEKAEALLSLAKCRAILGADAPESDAELELHRDALYRLARVVVEALPNTRREKRAPRAPNGARRAFEDAAKGKTGPANFSEALALLLEDERYEIEERAAIHEFDGGLDRSAAERLAISECWRRKHGGAFQRGFQPLFNITKLGEKRGFGNQRVKELH